MKVAGHPNTNTNTTLHTTTNTLGSEQWSAEKMRFLYKKIIFITF